MKIGKTSATLLFLLLFAVSLPPLPAQSEEAERSDTMATEEGKPSSLDDYIGEISAAFSEKRYREALALSDEALSLYPGESALLDLRKSISEIVNLIDGEEQEQPPISKIEFSVDQDEVLLDASGRQLLPKAGRNEIEFTLAPAFTIFADEVVIENPNDNYYSLQPAVLAQFSLFPRELLNNMVGFSFRYEGLPVKWEPESILNQQIQLLVKLRIYGNESYDHRMIIELSTGYNALGFSSVPLTLSDFRNGWIAGISFKDRFLYNLFEIEWLSNTVAVAAFDLTLSTSVFELPFALVGVTLGLEQKIGSVHVGLRYRSLIPRDFDFFPSNAVSFNELFLYIQLNVN